MEYIKLFLQDFANDLKNYFHQWIAKFIYEVSHHSQGKKKKKNLWTSLGKNIPTLAKEKVYNTQDGTVSLVKIYFFHI